MEQKRNNHHRIPRSKGGTNHKLNKKRMLIIEHREHHSIYGNDRPDEQFIRLLLLNEQVFRKEFVSKIMAVLEEFDGNYYKKKTIKYK